MRFTRMSGFLALLAIVILLGSSMLLAQNIVTGGISGTVTDPSGAVVPNAKITLKNNATGESQTTNTSSTGLFNFPLLKPGAYTMNISQSGFRSLTQSVDVELGQVTPANIKLVVGNTSETVEVTGTAPLLQTEDANISTTYTPVQIENLPNPGGDITSYAQTAPGVQMNTGGSYGNFSAFGLPSTSNLFTLNGNDENDPFLNLNNSGSSNLLLGQNEVQEVAVVSNGYTGQYGRQAGVQVDYTTKSGSNAFHGNASYWYNSTGFNANDWFLKEGQVANGLPNQAPFAVANQWAGSVGGPIKKDKLFFYVDQEGLYYALPSTQRVFFPTTAFSSAILSNIGATQPAELPYYTSLMNLYKNAPSFGSATPLGAGNPFDSTTFGCGDFAGTAGFGTAATPCLSTLSTSGVNHNKEWLLTTRIDYNISNSDKLFGRFKVDHGSQPTSTDLVDPAVFSTKSIQPEYEGQINETHIFSPTVVNNVIISGLWYTAIFLPDSGQAAVLSTLGMSSITFGSNLLSTLGGTSVPDFIFPQGRNSTMGQVTDDLSITRGAHTLKFGLNFRRDDLSDHDAQSNTGGFASIASMTDFYNGLINGANGDAYIQTFTSNPDVPIAFYSLGLYAQDEYRVSSNLKLTLALRADRNSNAVCQTDCFARFATPFTQMSHGPNIPYNLQILNGVNSAFPNIEKVALQPRFGFTWSPMGHTNTVLRGGIGVFSDLYQGVLLDSLISNTPKTNTFVLVPGAFGGSGAPLAPAAPGSAPAAAVSSNSALLSGFAAGENFAQIQAAQAAIGSFFSAPSFFSVANQINNPKYLEWNFEIQQAINPKTSFSLNYVGTHGYDILIQNPGVNAFNSSSPQVGFPLVPAVAPDSAYGQVSELSSSGNSNYDGLVASLNRRFSYGFQGSINYTFSHALDDVTSTNPGTPYNGITSLTHQINPYCLTCFNYGSSDSDARNNVTAQYVWNLPYKFQNKLENYVAGGWGVAGTIFYHSGFPYSVITPNTSLQNYLPNNPVATLGDFLGGPTASCGNPGSNYATNPNLCLFPSQFGNPTNGNVFGGTSRNYFRAPMYFDTDFTLMKNFAVTERVKFQIAANFYNILNHPNFAAPGADTASGLFGLITSSAVQPTTPYGSFQGAGVSGRLVQLQGKLTF